MIKKICFLLMVVLITPHVFSQQEYSTSTTYKDGYISIYYTLPTSIYSSTKDYRYGLIDEKSKKIVLPMLYKTVYPSGIDDIYFIKDTLDNFGMINVKTGKLLAPHEYSKMESFSEGLAIVQKKLKTKYSYDYVYGAIDNSGKVILPVTYDYLGTYKDGLFNYQKNKLYGFIDKTGKEIIPAMYTNLANFGNGLAPARIYDSTKSNLYGYINTKNKMVIPAIYENAKNFIDGYAQVYKKVGYTPSKYATKIPDEIGLIDANGKIIIDPKYEYISFKMEGGLFQARYREKYTLFDSTGKMILPLEYSYIGVPNQGYIIIKKEAKKTGLLNTKGEIVLPTEYEDFTSFYKGFASLKKDGKIKVIDENLKTIIPEDTAMYAKYGTDRILMIYRNKVKLYDEKGKLVKEVYKDNIESYNTTIYGPKDDSFRVSYGKRISLYNLSTKKEILLPVTEIGDFNEDGICVGKNDKYDFYDYTGKKLNSKSYYSVVNFSEGIAAVQENAYYSTPYLVDKSFKKIETLNQIFNGPYSEGLAKAKSQYGNTWYFLDTKGKSAFYLSAEDVGNCKNGLIRVQSSKDKFYYVRKNGKKLNNTVYDVLGDFYDGLAGFKINNKGGYIDTSGKVVIAAEYDDISNFSDGAAMVKKGTQFYQINTKNKVISSDEYVGASNPANGTFPIQKGVKIGLIDNKGKTIADFKYESIEPMYEERIWAKKDGKYGLLDNKGKSITDFIYTAVGNFSNGYAKVSDGQNVGLIDKSGKMIIPMEYTSIGTVYKNAIILYKERGSESFSVKK